MNQKQILALYGLKWNPFSPDIPDEALISNPKIDDFLWRAENLVTDGGFALVTGDPGLGKSVVLRLLSRTLSERKDLKIAEFSRPQSLVPDFYRELGSLFEVELNPHNHWRSFDNLRETWKNHIEASLFRPVLIIDEAQDCQTRILSELKSLSSMKFDSQIVLAVILSGDSRLPEKFRTRELLPFGSRIRTRLNLEPYAKEELMELLAASLQRAGSPKLMTKGLMNALVEHATGNPRIMMILGNEVLMRGAKQEAAVLDEKLFFDTLPQKKR